jgi:hypothetical protein
MAMAQMAHQPAEGGGGLRIIERVERIGIAIHHGFSLSCKTAVP